jgi:hypothetical protein
LMFCSFVLLNFETAYEMFYQKRSILGRAVGRGHDII